VRLFISLSLVSFFLSFFGTWVVWSLAKRKKWFDVVNERKAHHREVPRLGGIPLVASFMVCFGIVILLASRGKMPHGSFTYLYIPFLIILFLGIYDDFKGANAYQKFFFQIISALIIFHLSYRIQFLSVPFSGSVRVGVFWSYFLTVLWVVFAINAFNLIDGLDGLLTRIALYASLSMLVIFFVRGQSFLAGITLILSAALLGFLPWNLYPAKIFLGDSGSMFLGLVFAVLAMASSQKGPVAMSMAVPILIVIVPFLDTLWAFIRRIMHGKSPFKADMGHIHHKIFMLMGDHRKASFILSSLSGLFSLIGIFAAFASPRYRGFIVGLAFLIGIVLFLKLGVLKAKMDINTDMK